MIILQDTHFSELESLLCFVYNGEVNIEQENLPALLRAAETLQIRGLAGASEQVENEVQFLFSYNTKITLYLLLLSEANMIFFPLFCCSWAV